jgi:DNA polymerase I-like protein with 3'-5' exonuclease and polymerase domains
LPEDIIGGQFTRIDWLEPDFGKRERLANLLLKLGWQPEYFTETGIPQLVYEKEPVPSLEEIEGDLGKHLARWFTLNHRKNQASGFFKHLSESNTIPAECTGTPTNTFRVKHKKVANIPKANAKTILGKEMRSLFRARDGYYLLGYDASALEARVMGHYTWKYDNGEFALELLQGDIHTKNANHFKITRDQAKGVFYAIIYGAQPPKLAKMLKCSIKEAKKVFNDFWKINPGLGRLREKVISISNRAGYVPGLDGRLVYTRSEHSALNTVFQSAGAIIMKYSMLLMEKYKTDIGFDYEQIIFYHDEFEGEVLERSVYETDTGLWCLAADYSIKSLEEAGRLLGVRVPLTGEAKIGRTWADVH